jgi:uncharacterized protein
MANIIKEILTVIPKEKISDAVFEGANIVFYTKDADFFLNNKGIVKEAVSQFKKRIELRPDPSISLDPEKAKEIILSTLPKEAGIGDILFSPHRSLVTIEAEKPGLAIGKQGSLLRSIKEKTMWVPFVRRTPAMKSKLIENVRAVLYQNSDYRRKFLDKVGHRIYDGWKRGKKDEWVRMTWLGAGRQVGRSCMLLQTPESRVLVDCGVNVAGTTPSESYPYLDVPEFNINELDAVILSHSHMDHCGFIPYLYKYGYRGPVYCTKPTRDVTALALLDYVKIMKSDRGESLYDVDDVKEMVKHIITLDFEVVTDITPDIRLTLYNSGHILGSSLVHMHVGNGLHNIVYTGDLKYGKGLVLEPATAVFPRLETLIIEGTYGGKTNVMPPAREQDNYLKDIITKTVQRGGKVLMPVLGSGRAQDIIVMVEAMLRTGELEALPVYIDGMLWHTTAIHTAYPEFLNNKLRKMIFQKDQNPFLNENFKRVGSHKERMGVIEYEGPCVILATSGMMVGGPSVEYFKQLADNPKNSIVFSSYLAENSLAKRIHRGEKEIAFMKNGKQDIIRVQMEVHKIEITGHSDRKQLMNFIYQCNPKPKRVFY